MGGSVKTETDLPWEAFCDESYYQLWCVRRKAERDFGQGYHVMSKGEADHLVNLLNRVAA